MQSWHLIAISVSTEVFIKCTWRQLPTCVVTEATPTRLLRRNAYLAEAFRHCLATHSLGALGNYWRCFQHVVHVVRCAGLWVHITLLVWWRTSWRLAVESYTSLIQCRLLVCCFKSDIFCLGWIWLALIVFFILCFMLSLLVWLAVTCLGIYFCFFFILNHRNHTFYCSGSLTCPISPWSYDVVGFQPQN